jgi:hypothetical protein
MDTWLTVAFLVAFISYLLWAFTGSYLSVTLRDHWPDLHARLGSPKPGDFWSRRMGVPLDQFTLTRRFRQLRIENGDILLQLELTCWLRWAAILGMVALVILLFASVAQPHVP